MGNKSTKTISPEKEVANGTLSTRSPASYKLTYFDIRGRAETTRILFALAGVDYTDHRISYAEWPQIKSEMPFGQVPVLEVSRPGMKSPLIIHQAHAIERYLAREFGLMGGTNADQAVAEAILETSLDAIAPITLIYNEKDDAKKAEVLAEYRSSLLPRFLEYLTMRLNKKSWFMDQVTLADIFVYNVLENITLFIPTALEEESGSALKEWKSRLESIPNLQKWLKERPPHK